MPLTHALIFNVTVCPRCASFQVLWKSAQGFPHLSSEAALNEDLPFVRTCVYRSEQQKRSENAIYTFFF